MKTILITFLLLTSIFAYSNEVTIKDIENYLNSVQSFKSDFLQEDNLGNIGQGVIYIQKPFSFRLEMFKPSNTVMIGNKSLIIYHDYELNEISHTSANNGAINLLVTDNIKFSNEKVEIKSFKNHYSTLEIELIDKDQPDIGTITMVFSKSPIALQQFRIKQEGSKLIMSLYNRQTNIKIDKEKFTFEYPQVKNPYKR